jgi:uncharacterized protein HemX
MSEEKKPGELVIRLPNKSLKYLWAVAAAVTVSTVGVGLAVKNIVQERDEQIGARDEAIATLQQQNHNGAKACREVIDKNVASMQEMDDELDRQNGVINSQQAGIQEQSAVIRTQNGVIGTLTEIIDRSMGRHPSTSPPKKGYQPL